MIRKCINLYKKQWEWHKRYWKGLVIYMILSIVGQLLCYLYWDRIHYLIWKKKEDEES